MAAESCPRPAELGEPKLEFQLVDPAPKLRHDLDIAGLQRKVGRGDRPASSGFVQGLTVSKGGVELQAHWRQGRKRDGSGCLWVQSVEARLALNELTVYIASDYAPGSCEYEAILAHENRHVRIHHEVLEQFSAPVRQALEEGLRRNAVIAVSSGAFDSNLLIRRLQEPVHPILLRMQAELARRNGLLDTPEAYRRDQQESGCHHWKGVKSRFF